MISLPKFAAGGWLLDLTNRVSQTEIDDYLAADLQAGMYQGRLYRIPAFTDAGILYYRKDLVAEPPATFDELVALSRKFQSPERYGFLWQGKQYEGLITVYLETLWGFGGDWIDRQTGEVLLDRPEALHALEFSGMPSARFRRRPLPPTWKRTHGSCFKTEKACFFAIGRMSGRSWNRRHR